MAAGKHGSSEITISIEDGPGGTSRAITPYVQSISGVKLEALTQATHAFGDTFEEHTPTGMKKVPDITLTGFFDDTATVGPHVVFIAPDDGPQDDGRELIVVFGNSKTFTVDVRLVSYEVLGKNGALTEYAAVLRPTGAGVWT